ncbi:MAG: hypothetical protein LC731_01850, partial [Acidobacteria bacterium]|nr:hypothetical protein [Acidobacteriota bacterium]
MPYTSKWYATFEQQLGSARMISAGYVGAAGRRLLLTESVFDRNADFPFIRLTTNGAKSDYHSFQVQFYQRLSLGLQAMASYTLSKSTDDYSQDSAAVTLPRGGDARLERGPSDFDVRHVFAGSIAYEIPAPFKEGIGNSLTRRWILMGLFNARSGKPLNVAYGFPTDYGMAYLRPNLVEGVPLYLNTQSTAGRRINPSAFSVPATLRQGNLGRNSLRGLPLYQFDLALHRQFNFTDSFSLQLRIEGFNLFNRPNFEDPAGTDLSIGNRSSALDPLRLNTTFGQSATMYGRSLWGGPGSSFSSFY